MLVLEDVGLLTREAAVVHRKAGALDVGVRRMFFILIPAYVYPDIHMHLPPLPYSYTFLAIFICIVCVMFYIYTHILVCFLLFPKLNRHLCYGVY